MSNLLVSVCGDGSALWGVRFLGWFFDHKERLRLTVYNTPADPFATQGVLPGQGERAHLEREKAHREVQSRECLERARDLLVSLGFPPQNVQEKLRFHGLSTAQNILLEGTVGRYDAVVLGRRGLSWLEEFIGDSVSRNTFSHQVGTPLWVCREPEEGRSSVLLCVDGSSNAEAMVVHVGYILAGEERHDLGLFMVADGGRQPEPEDVFRRCIALLAENGVDPSRVHTRVEDGGSPAKAILREVERGRYAVVAAGKTGHDRGAARGLFVGSVAESLFRTLRGAALWLVQPPGGAAP